MEERNADLDTNLKLNKEIISALIDSHRDGSEKKAIQKCLAAQSALEEQSRSLQRNNEEASNMALIQ